MQQELNRLLAERITVTMHTDRTMTAAVRGGGRMNIIRLGQNEIVDAGVLDEHGYRLTWTYDA